MNANLRRRDARLRRNLQRKGTQSAKRLPRRRRRKEARFAACLNHKISKRRVRKAKDTGRGIALEDLTHIRDRTMVRRPQRRAHHSWAFAQLRSFLTYKARLAGVPLVAVDPACGCIARENRPTRDHLLCISRGHTGHADTTAARTIFALGSCHAAARGAERLSALASRLLELAVHDVASLDAIGLPRHGFE